jgi:hypothetical protein
MHLHLLLTTLIWVFTNDVLFVSDLLQTSFDFGGFLVWSVLLCCRRVPWRPEVNFLGSMSQIQSLSHQATRAVCYSSARHGDTWSRLSSSAAGTGIRGAKLLGAGYLLLLLARGYAEPNFFCWARRSSSAGYGDTRSQRSASSAGHGDTRSQRSASSAGMLLHLVRTWDNKLTNCLIWFRF